MSLTSPVNYTPVVLCGGSWSRLWPLSRTGFPKQFLVLHGTQSLFQQSVQRLFGLTSPSLVAAQPLIVTNESHRFLVAEQWRELDVGTDALLLLEPEGRNTAPAITLAAKAAIAAAPADIDPILVVSPADQVVTDGVAFRRALTRAIERAQNGTVVVLGVPPASPETGYGYIRRGAKAAAENAWPVIQFT